MFSFVLLYLIIDSVRATGGFLLLPILLHGAYAFTLLKDNPAFSKQLYTPKLP